MIFPPVPVADGDASLWYSVQVNLRIGFPIGAAVAADSASAVFLYDTTLNVTWLRDANARGTTMNWDTANTWANTLMVGAYSGWRLPTMIDTGTPGCNWSAAGGTDCGDNVQSRSGGTTYSEMAHLFFATLGNKSYCPPGDATCAGGPQAGWGLTNTGTFQNMQSRVYWSGLESAPSPSYAWRFTTFNGNQDAYYKYLQTS